MDLPRLLEILKLLKVDRGFGIFALAAADPGALGLDPGIFNLPDHVTLSGIGVLLYGMVFGDRRPGRQEPAPELAKPASPPVDPIRAAAAVEQCRRADIDPQLVAEGVEQSRRERQGGQINTIR